MTQPAALNSPIAAKSAPTDKKSVIETIDGRKSKELIIGLCGAIGSGTRDLTSEIKACLEQQSYSVETIKISDIIFRLANDASLNSLTGYKRYRAFQDAGNKIRKDKGAVHLAEQAVVEIVDKREKHVANNLDNKTKEDAHKNTKAVAYIIDQLKHPDEVKLLQKIYQRNFYLIGLLRTESDRKTALKQMGMGAKDVDDLVHIDRKEPDKFGQQVEDTFYLADYFVRNKNSAADLTKSVERFVRLVHGHNGTTPTKDETGMYTAASAAVRSACLSRQVGAAIMNQEGDILSTGCNDVPSYGGGLYTAESKDDKRCIFKGKQCYNDHHKDLLKNEFQEVLNEELKKMPQSENVEIFARDIAEKILKNSRAKSLIEFSRAVHAEMDAIIQLARIEGSSTLQTTLYSTTYPCHSCARHIVAAGVSRVVYIEPYEKSLALPLHDDAISDTNEPNKVSFEPFEGVAPSRYFKFFQYTGGRKKDAAGKAIIPRPADSQHADPQYLDDYFEYEAKVVERLVPK